MITAPSKAAASGALASGFTNPDPAMPERRPAEPSIDDTAAAMSAETARMLRPSKTRLKQESHDLQALGIALLDFTDERLLALGLNEPLVDAIRAGRRITAHEGRRRQLQLIGKLMRGADVAPIREAVARSQIGHAHDTLALHRAERWRAELIAADEATTRFATAHTGADLQQLRALVRNARKDAARVAEQRSGRAYRELFQFIREHEERG